MENLIEYYLYKRSWLKRESMTIGFSDMKLRHISIANITNNLSVVQIKHQFSVIILNEVLMGVGLLEGKKFCKWNIL